jgi:Tfp pilus assembly protein PilX
MIPAFSSGHRRGYSLTVVLLFLVLLLFLWAAVYRTTASFLRVETARVKRNDLDEGMQAVLAKALWYLETNPTLPRNQVTYGITVPVNPNNPEGPNFTATFTPSPPPNGWTIQVTPGTCSTQLPGS